MRRRWLVPEVVQTSAMDCGPAALKAVFEGFGISLSYGRLREACQTTVDGTSIDTLEELVNSLGLEGEQVVIPRDHVSRASAGGLPAIAVVQQPDGLTHFVVAWRLVGGSVQLMDPATGRRWVTRERFFEDLYEHTAVVPSETWREYADSDEFRAPLQERLQELGLRPADASRLILDAAADPSWKSLAALDAATRFANLLVSSRAVSGPRAVTPLVTGLFEAERARVDATTIPKRYWTVRPDESGANQVAVRGAVLVRVRSRASAPEPALSLPRELAAALGEKRQSPLRTVLASLRADGVLSPLFLTCALLLSGTTIMLEALLFRAIFDIPSMLGGPSARIGAVAVLASFLLATLLLELPIAWAILKIGRRLEARLRLLFQMKLPRLDDGYFRSRPVSDMAERSHVLHIIRILPSILGTVVRTSFSFALTVLGLIWLDPEAALPVLAAAGVSIAVPFVFQPMLSERELRARTHGSALGRCYLDALLGLVAVRAHGAQTAMRREHEGLLVHWQRAMLSLQRTAVGIEAAVALVGLGSSALLVVLYLGRGGNLSGVLLLAYWALSIPALGQQLALAARQYPALRNVILRLVEPLGAPEVEQAPMPASIATAPAALGAAIRFEGVSVRAGGHTLLDSVSFSVAAGAHVAIVGPSGAGKSTLLGVLLGWHRPSAGRLIVDGTAVDASYVETLRGYTAWVDPAIQLWNRTLLDNLMYGAGGHPSDIGEVLRSAALLELVETLPDGLQTRLGEGGALVSGGEGQRVRIGRALMRSGTRLALLDEPLRGLDRTKRRELLAQARIRWRGATMLAVSHDIAETLDFDAVLVVQGGRLTEAGRPSELAGNPKSEFAAMLRTERELHEKLWSTQFWEKRRIVNGHLEAEV